MKKALTVSFVLSFGLFICSCTGNFGDLLGTSGGNPADTIGRHHGCPGDSLHFGHHEDHDGDPDDSTAVTDTSVRIHLTLNTH